MNEKVDVLIIGSGASGAAAAWSLADSRMRILCLEQGDWMKSTDFPSNGRDWEARRYTDFDIRPNFRGRDTDDDFHRAVRRDAADQVIRRVGEVEVAGRVVGDAAARIGGLAEGLSHAQRERVVARGVARVARLRAFGHRLAARELTGAVRAGDGRPVVRTLAQLAEHLE